MTTKILFTDGSEIDSSELTTGQRLMVEDGFPTGAIIPTEERTEVWKGRKPRETNTFADVKSPKSEDPGTLALLEEQKAEARAAEKAKKTSAKEAKIIKARQRAKPAAEAAIQESSVMKKTSKKIPAAKKAAGKPTSSRAGKTLAKARVAKSNARTAAGVKVDVVQKIADMMASKGGASMAEMVKATGIEAHPMRAKIKLVRDRLGYTTTAPSKENDFRYHAQAPKKGGA